MIPVAISFITAAFAAGLAALIAKLTLAGKPSTSARLRARVWAFVAFLPAMVFSFRLLSGLNIFPLFEALSMKLLGVSRIGQTLYIEQGSLLKPTAQASSLAEPLLAVWALGAAVILIARGYQLFLAHQFTLWAEDTSDQRLAVAAESFEQSYGLGVRPRIRDSYLVRSPLVVGILRFTLLMPKGLSAHLSDRELRAILAHEYSHISRQDTRTLALLVLAESLFWFNPITWFVHREWATCRELDADREALIRTNIEPKDFANLLLRVITTTPQPRLQTALGATRDFKALRTRILNMKNIGTRETFPLARVLSALAVFALFMISPWIPSVAIAATDDGNIVIDGGFENGLDQWLPGTIPSGASTGVDYSLDTNVKHSGKASLKFEKTKISFFPVQFLAARLKSSFKITRKIETTCWIKTQNATKATIALNFEGNDGAIKWGAYIGHSNSSSSISQDWTRYRSVLEVPDGTTSVQVWAQMYGPGEVWIDDVSVRFVDDSTPVVDPTAEKAKVDDGADDVASVPSIEFQAKKDPNKDYFLVGSKGKGPEGGYKLLLVLPGGDGSKDFNPFVRRMWMNAALEKSNFVVAELVAPVWDRGDNRIVWPIKSTQTTSAAFRTEQFVNDVIDDVKSKLKIDLKNIYILGWSSSGPACYNSLLESTSIKGAFIGMSIFAEGQLSNLKFAKGRSFYLYQSPDDQVTKFFFAEKARDALTAVGARVQLVSYSGGHGFSSGSPFEDIREGLDWLIKQ